MTNSKQWCDYCGERYSYEAHKYCSLIYKMFNKEQRSLYKDDVKVSTVAANLDGTFSEIGENPYKKYETEAEWKAAYPGAVEK